MSDGLDILAPKEDDVTKLLMSNAHIGTKNVDFQMKKYVYKRRSDGVHIINLHKTWEKILLAARIIVAIDDPKDVCAISGATYGQRAILKFSTHVGATPIAGRFTPGAFTNQIQKTFQEPRLLIVTDPRIDHQPIREASYVNIPTIAFCNTDSPVRFVDVVIPCNNKSVHSVGLMWWLLAREVLRLRGAIDRSKPWDIMVDLYFYRDPEEVAKEEQAAALKGPEFEGGNQQWEAAEGGATAAEGEWANAAPNAFQAEASDWANAGATSEWGAASSDWAAAQ